MLELTPEECRALGVLVEKAQTTPDAYPLSLNALTNGANQKNNRRPIMDLTDDQVFSAVTGLRNKGLLIQLDTPGSRVSKYRHNAQEKLGLTLRQLVVLAELLLRGPQTLGELRGRATRMHPLESIEMVQSVLDELMSRPEPLVQKIAPAPGDRAERYLQLLCPDAHPLDLSPAPAEGAGAGAPAAAPTLSTRLAELEAKVAELESTLRHLCAQLGVGKPA
jgi:uncharacterized protein YceH (UPF0502 family)